MEQSDEEAVLKYTSLLEENKNKVDAYTQWLSYYAGFSGQGTTALDIKPNFEMPNDVPSLIRMMLIIMMMDECTNRAESFRLAILETTGENIGRHRIVPKKLSEEFDFAQKDFEYISRLKQNILKETEQINERMEKINSSGWLFFKSMFTGEFAKLIKKSTLLFELFDDLDKKQGGVTK